MADKEVGGLTAATTLDGSELLHVVQGSNSRKTTVSAILGTAHSQAWSGVTGTPSTVSGYGITDAQAKNANLTAIAALSPTSKSVIIGNGSAWTAESGATFRSSVGLAIGSDVQAYDADLTALGGLAKADGNVIIGDGTTWTVESGATLRTSFGLSIGTDVQAYNATLASLAGLTLTDGDLLYSTGASALANLARGSDGQVLRLSGGMPSWASVTGTGDMAAAIYDPNAVGGDAFSQDNMVDGTTNKNFTAAEKTKLAGAGDMLAANNGSDFASIPTAFNNIVADASVSTAKLADGGVTPSKLNSNVRTSMLVNSMRAAENFGSGPSADGKTFVDLLNSTDTLDIAASSNVQFRQGGIEPASGPGTATDAAYALTSGSNPGWTDATIAIQLTAEAIADAAENCKYVRATWRAGTDGGLTVNGAFIGVHLASSAGEFDPAYPVVPLMFAAAASGAATAGNTLVSDWAEYSIPVGKALYVAYYVSAGGYVATKTQTGWQSFYKTTTNEPAKYKKSGYSNTATVLGLERLEYANSVNSGLTVVSKQLPLSAAPTKVDVALFLDCDSGDVGDFSLSLSRDGATWKAVTLGDLYTVNEKIGRAAYGVDLSIGAGTGSALYWKAATANGKAIKVTAIAVRQEDGIFTDVPSINMRPSAPVVTHHKEMTGLGYGDPVLKYGRLWGFTQDFEAKGPTRFHIKFRAQVVMTSTPMANPTSNPLQTTPVMFTVPMTVTTAATLAALGAKNFTETDTTPATGNNDLKWLSYSSGNIYGTNEHYKEALIDLTFDAVDPGGYRFEVWGISQTDADPNVSGHIATNWGEAYGVSAGGGFKYNRLEIVAEPLR